MGDLRKMLDPGTVALVGASEKEGSIGRRILTNLRRSYKGRIFPVNPAREKVLDLECYRSVSAVQQAIDLAVIAVPAGDVPAVVDECGRAGVQGVVIISTGFRETGPSGRQLEQKVRELHKKYGLRVVGPGSLGVIRPEIGLNTTFFRADPQPGNIAFISQTGELGEPILEWGIEAEIGFSMFTSLGSMIDVDFGDIIDFLGDDFTTRSILLHMEFVGNARKFMSATRGFARSKPIIILKPGRFFESIMAETSRAEETLDGDSVYNAAFKRVGAVRVEEAVDLFNTAKVLDSRSVPLGPALAIVGNAGTAGIMAADALLERGGRLAKLSSETLSALDDTFPCGWNRGNPVDLQGEADVDRYVRAITACLADRSVNGILVIHAPHATTFPRDLATAVAGVARTTAKPILAAFVGGPEMNEGVDILERHDIPAYRTPEEAAKTYVYMYNYRRSLDLLYQTPADLPMEGAPRKYHLKTLVDRASREGARVLGHEKSLGFLANYGIPVRRGVQTATMGEVRAEAANFGFPVIISLVPVSSDGSGIRQRVEVRTMEEMDTALEELERQRKEAPEGAYLDTVTIRHVTGTSDYELYLGMARDREFGSVIRFGIGGMGRDIFKDCAIGLPPLNQTLALRLIEESKVSMLLSGYEGRKAIPLSTLEQILVGFSNLIVDFPEITAIDIDPLAASEGSLEALDARIFLGTGPGTAHAYPHLVITPYPTRYITTWRFRDGTEVLLRPIRPEDEPLLEKLYVSLSQMTLEQRFFRVIKDMPSETLRRFCNIDYDREIAIVAELREGGARTIIGTSRLIIQPNSRAEFAVVVQDAYQGRGLGSKLIDVVIGIGRDKGLKEIYGIVLTENTGMLKLVRRLGFATSKLPDGISSVSLKLV